MSTLMNRPPARLGNGLAVLDVLVEEADDEVAGLLLDGIDFVVSLDVCDGALVANDLLRADRPPVISVRGMVEASPPHALARALEQLVELLEQSLEVVVVAPEHEDGEVRRDRLDALQRALQVHLIVAEFLSELEVPLGARPLEAQLEELDDRGLRRDESGGGLPPARGGFYFFLAAPGPPR